MENKEVKFIRKQGFSKADFIAQVVEMIVGAIMAIVGFVMSLFSAGGGQISSLVLPVGGYLFVSGAAGMFVFGGSSFLFDKGRYIGFSDEALIIHYKKKDICIPFQSISDIRKASSVSFDIPGKIVLMLKGAGYVSVVYTNDKGEKDTELVGPIDNCKEFICQLKKTQEK